MTAKTTTHTGATGHIVRQLPRRGTGLHVAGEINGRPGTDDELAIRERVYTRQRAADAELVKVAARSQP